ncbi:murein transglycosylase A [Mannheimia sp. AT1]|uniref:Membrane-bound lytic murein transglycosylase A n=1 Tax=Mannheimia cairinae TaxID=3025936 RepID=A0ABT5MLQ3_9PAST|nr:murein transglycosylase A [Mannheimia cairinae]MDD0822932.1 murein transglycosylase A [Mannheimia cairinae]MDD0826040.1 murein transglycosylase A [Mannheimia cairinae]
MSWKAYKKALAVTAISLATTLLVSCSSSDPKSKSSSSEAEKAKFGAKYSGRQFMPYGSHFQSGRLSLNAAPVNQRDFLQQLSNVRAYSRLANTHALAYGKVSNWIASGGNINDLAKYGINTRLMRGDDGYQNVLMTGYYIPVIEASSTRRGEFQHPVYGIPQGNRKYSRAEIYAGALNGRGLELAYSNSMLDNFLMEVQGSGFMKVNGQLRHFAYGNKNGYGYTSIGRLLVEDGEIPKEKMSIQAIRQWAAHNPSRLQGLLERNQSYVYFREDPTFDVKGSAGVPLVPLASVASDRTIVPSGSVLLVEMPLIDHKGKWTGKHQMRLMIALDVGGAVKGHHFDLYQGIGDKAGHTAGLLKHYGRVWVLN